MSGLHHGYYSYPYIDQYTNTQQNPTGSNEMAPAETKNPKTSVSKQPRLIRTSSLPINFIKQNYNLLKTPIKLSINKDITSVLDNWSDKEYEAQRRLVNFNFIQRSSTQFSVVFDPISASQFTIGDPIISCIYWREENKYIVTSVDIVLLLEYLIRQNFTVEEKNRIRRNLQGLKPTTVSRSNVKFLRFFKLIMSMEDPRPRNIEKDIKVFNWEDLPVALNKIIAKYSANDLSIQDENFSNNFASNLSNFYTTEHDLIGSNRVVEGPQTAVEPPSTASNFLPFERIKVMRKKMIQSNSNSILKNKKIFQHAIEPVNEVKSEHSTINIPPSTSNSSTNTSTSSSNQQPHINGESATSTPNLHTIGVNPNFSFPQQPQSSYQYHLVPNPPPPPLPDQGLYVYPTTNQQRLPFPFHSNEEQAHPQEPANSAGTAVTGSLSQKAASFSSFPTSGTYQPQIYYHQDQQQPGHSHLSPLPYQQHHHQVQESNQLQTGQQSYSNQGLLPNPPANLNLPPTMSFGPSMGGPPAMGNLPMGMVVNNPTINPQYASYPPQFQPGTNQSAPGPNGAAGSSTISQWNGY